MNDETRPEQSIGNQGNPNKNSMYQEIQEMRQKPRNP